jgi:hypothetical protein
MAAGLGLGIGRDIVSELNHLAAIETAVGLLVEESRAIRVGWYPCRIAEHVFGEMRAQVAAFSSLEGVFIEDGGGGCEGSRGGLGVAEEKAGRGIGGRDGG